MSWFTVHIGVYREYLVINKRSMAYDNFTGGLGNGIHMPDS